MSAESEASKNFAFLVAIARSHFEVLERLILKDLISEASAPDTSTAVISFRK